MSRSSALRVDALVVKFRKMREVRERLDILIRGFSLVAGA